MATVIAFDIYGTLINTHGVVTRLQEYIGDNAQTFSNVWRDKQLEYSFRRGLMNSYQPFSVCTSQALDYVDQMLSTGLSDSQKSSLLAEYRVLPAFEDVIESLTTLKSAGHKMYAFSNGTADAVEGLLANAGIRELFDGVVSVDPLQTFKPNPDVYAHMVKTGGATVAETWLISSNPFDVIGAATAGLKTAWIQRSQSTVFDPWGVEPTVVVESLTQLALDANMLKAPTV
ncbi:haloacid dehalogenase type II [Leucothrix arctica]|uniref:(S)-2-haloacid dehalogenase n=1 Tax=Leucothrix arctica TaxID=1481894 RepID=A0A317CC47_9GAMM|nr:haloacid dehalogenase type II [Leucothrix arctica]PWQ95949.1 haloacid dehalogenase type II [Leucothrix arctica]